MKLKRFFRKTFSDTCLILVPSQIYYILVTRELDFCTSEATLNGSPWKGFLFTIFYLCAHELYVYISMMSMIDVSILL